MFSFKHDCEEHGHKFEARVSYGTPKNFKFDDITGINIVKVIEAFTPKTYIHDICTKCGKIVK